MSSPLIVEVEGQEIDACVKVEILEAFKAETEVQSGPEQRERLLASISKKKSSFTNEAELAELAELRIGSSTITKVPINPKLAEMLAKVSSWKEFDVLKVAEVAGGRPLAAVVNAILIETGLMELFKIDAMKMEVFMRDLEVGYKSNPYHNSVHAADVVQAVYTVIKKDNLMAKLKAWEVLGLILAAAGHDVGHPGLTNKYLCETHAAAAVTYGYASPNENTHAATTINLLLDTKVLDHLPVEEFEVIRSMITDVILPTDMVKHHDVVGNFAKQVETYGSDLSTWNVNAERTKALAMLVHMADISNVARPRPLAIKWGQMVMSEAHEQGDRERAQNMAVCALNDRTNPDLPSSQQGFITYFKIREAFVSLAAIAPAFVDMVLPLLDGNLAFYNDLVARHIKSVPESSD